MYVYDAFGALSAEYSSNPTPASVACDRCYLSTDQVGSTRMVTDVLGNVVSFHDYLAFGGELDAGYAGRTNPWGSTADNVSEKFTGQERDTESGLDYFNARYFAAALGRFTSPDPGNAGADLMSPQSWNGYAYVGNNPLAFVDPSGMDCVKLDGGGTGDDGQGTTCPGSHDPGVTNVPGGVPLGSWAWWWDGEWRTLLGGAGGNSGAGGSGGGGGSTSSPGGNNPGSQQGPGKTGIITKVKNLLCSAIPDARTITVGGGIGAIGSTHGSLQASLDYRTGQTSLSASGGFQLGWNGVLLGQVSAGFVYGSSNSNRSVGYSGGTAISGYVSTSGNAREYGVGVGISLTEGVGGGRTVSLSTPSIGHVMGLETPLDSGLILAKQAVCPWFRLIRLR